MPQANPANWKWQCCLRLDALTTMLALALVLVLALELTKMISIALLIVWNTEAGNEPMLPSRFLARHVFIPVQRLALFQNAHQVSQGYSAQRATGTRHRGGIEDGVIDRLFCRFRRSSKQW